MQSERRETIRPLRIADYTRPSMDDRLRAASGAAMEIRRRLARRLEPLAIHAALERERRRIADGLHDDVGPALAAALLRLESLRRSQRCEEEVADVVREVGELLRNVLEQVRSLTFELGSPGLCEPGLIEGIEGLCADIERENGLRVELAWDRGCETIQGPARVEIYRAVRELLHNVVKHANAGSTCVEIRQGSAELRVVVEDDGVGLDAAGSGSERGQEGFGLTRLRQRLRTLGGRLDVGARPGGGTRAVLSVPVGRDGPGP